MSRVRHGQKYVNTAKYGPEITGPSKMERIHFEGEDYHKACTLSAWLFVKYDMTYKAFRNKSKNRREELRQEYEADTGNTARRQSDHESVYDDDFDYDDAVDFLADIGVPISLDGSPLGIGWDD